MRSIITPDHILSHPDVTFCEGDELYHITYISSYHYPDPGFITIMTPHQSSYLVIPLTLQSSSYYLQVAAVVHNELQQNEKFLSDFKRSVGYLKVTLSYYVVANCR